MGYTYGATHRTDPRTALQTITQSLKTSKAHLAALDEQVSTASRELLDIQRKTAKARREHAAYMRDRANDPDRTPADAKRAYEIAIARHPEDKRLGAGRRRLLAREVEAATKKAATK